MDKITQELYSFTQEFINFAIQKFFFWESFLGWGPSKNDEKMLDVCTIFLMSPLIMLARISVNWADAFLWVYQWQILSHYSVLVWSHQEIKKKTLWPLFMDGVQLPQGYSHFEEAVYFLPFSSQKFLVLILLTLEGWKAESTLEPPTGFEHRTPGSKKGFSFATWRAVLINLV